MTDRFALEYAAKLVVARIKDTSVETVKAAANIVDLVEARTRLRKVGGRYTGLCPFHQEKTPSFSVSPDRGTYHCFGCGVGGDAISFVREIEGLDFVGAIEWLADRFRVELEYEESSPEADAQRRRRERLYALLDQAATFYERVLWTESGKPVQEYLASRGLGEEACREFRLGLSPAGATLARRRRRRDSRRRSSPAQGSSRSRGTDYFQRRLMFPLADARGRVIGFQARKLHDDDPLKRQVRQLAGERALPQVARPLRAAPRAAGDHEGGSRDRRRGKHRRDRAPAGRSQAGRRLDGNRADRAAAARALAADAAPLPLLRLRRRRRGRDAARDGARDCARASTFGSSRCRRGKDPADDPAGFEERLGEAEPYAVHRVRLELDRARDKQHAYLRVQDVLNGIPESPERHDAWRLANDLLGLTIQLRAAGARRGRRGRLAAADRRGGQARARGARRLHRASGARPPCSAR